MTNDQVWQFNNKASIFLWLEWTVLFIMVPSFFRFCWNPKLLFGLFFATTIFVASWLYKSSKSNQRYFWSGNHILNEYQQLKQVLLRFAVCGTLITFLVLLIFPNNFLDLPREKPLEWALIIILYPLFSVYPQELIYRTFFFERYRKLFPNHTMTVLASALAFSFVHIIFQNHLAVLLTLIAGVFFADTYARTRSLRLVWLEHVLYGCLIFTIGLGDFFCHSRIT